MKRTIAISKAVLVLILVMVIALNTYSSLELHQNNDGITISGQIDALPTNVNFYLVGETENGTADTLQQIAGKNGSFQFKNVQLIKGQFLWLKMDTSTHKLPEGKPNWVMIIYDSSDIKLSGVFGNWPEVAVQGSSALQDFNQYLEMQKKEIDKIREAENMQDTALVKKTMGNYSKFFRQFISANPDNYITARLILNASLFEDADKIDWYEKLSTRVKESFYGKRLSKYIHMKKKVSKIMQIFNDNKRIPDFRFTAPDGAQHSILEVASKSKYTLIDFWASWCSPCRQSIPRLKKVYEDFRSKGFNIVGISTDKDSNAWKKALVEDKTSWMHGLDNMEHAWKEIFMLGSIPAYILIDNKGNVVEMDYIMEGQQLNVVKPGKKYLTKDLREILESLLK